MRDIISVGQLLTLNGFIDCLSVCAAVVVGVICYRLGSARRPVPVLCSLLLFVLLIWIGMFQWLLRYVDYWERDPAPIWQFGIGGPNPDPSNQAYLWLGFALCKLLLLLTASSLFFFGMGIHWERARQKKRLER